MKKKVSVMKASNPKEAFGSDKLPLHLFPMTARAWGCIGLLEGALKYGRNNFRKLGVRSSTYYSSVGRHMDLWFEGQDHDPVTQIHHLANAIAGIAILIEAIEAGNLNDDRNFPGGYIEGKARLEAKIPFLKRLFAKENPKHYTIGDE
jgi:hypothetical protein